MRCKRCRLVLRTTFAKCEPPRSNLRSLAYKRACSLVSLDYPHTHRDLRTRSSFSPPSHSLLFVGRTRRITQYTASGMRRIKTNSALPTRCFGRFRCVKNNTQLFLTCYILAAMPTQLSLCATSVSSKSCATCKSSFVAISDFPARKIGSWINSLTM